MWKWDTRRKGEGHDGAEGSLRKETGDPRFCGGLRYSECFWDNVGSEQI